MLPTPYRRRRCCCPAIRSSVVAAAFVPAALLCIAPSASWAQGGQEKQQDFPKVEASTPPTDKAPPTAPGKVGTVEVPQPLTLGMAIDLALQLQPDVAVAVANREEAQQRERASRSGYYPSLTPQYTYLNQYTFGTVNQFVGGGTGVVPVQQGRTSETRQAQFGLNYRLFDSGNRELLARQSRQSLRARQFGESNTRQIVIGDVADRYFQALRTAALVKVSQSQVARALNTLEVVRAQVDAEVAARKDIFQAEADYLNAQVNLTRARNDAAVAQANLKNSIGLVGGQPLQLAEVPEPTEGTPSTVTLEGTTSLSAAADQQGDAATIDRLADLAYRSRPDLAQGQQNVEASHTNTALARLDTVLQVNTNFTASNQLNPTEFDRSLGNNRQLNVGLSYPLFDGGFVRSQYRAAQAGARAQEANLTGLRQQVAVEVEQAFRNLTQARAALPAARAATRAAEVNYEAAIESRREGVGSIVEVITAQTSLVQAQTNYVQSIYDFYGADARLARAVGQSDKIAQASGATASTAAAGGTVTPATSGNRTPAAPVAPPTSAPAPTTPAPTLPTP